MPNPAEFVFDRQGYKINNKIPKYSGAYNIYKIQQIPTYDVEWYQIENIEKTVIMNQVHDTINFDEVKQFCTQKEENYFCALNAVAIHGKPEKSCSMQLVLNHILKTGNFSLCKLEKMYYKTKQQYLIKTRKFI